jgi:hypothetical protein
MLNKIRTIHQQDIIDTAQHKLRGKIMRNIAFIAMTALSLSCYSNARASQLTTSDQKTPNITETTKNEKICSINIWISNNYGAYGSSGIGALLLGGAGELIEGKLNEDSNKIKASQIIEDIPQDKISDLLKMIKIESIIKRTVETTIYIDNSNNIQELVATKIRNTEKLNKCYFEIFVNSIMLSQRFNQSTIASTISWKVFDGNNVKRRSYYFAGQNLSVYPTKDPLKKSEALDDLYKKFSTSIEVFFSEKLYKDIGRQKY